MTDMVKIEGRQIEKLEYKNQPVVTMGMVDDLHQRVKGTARRTFNKNRERFIEGVDYFCVPRDEFLELGGRITSATSGGGHHGDGILFTESGYYLLTKPMKDDLSWRVFRVLLSDYFRMREQAPPATQGIDYDVYTAEVQKEAKDCLKQLELVVQVLGLPQKTHGVIKAMNEIITGVVSKVRSLAYRYPGDLF